MRLILLCLGIFFFTHPTVLAQSLPFKSIPPAPDTFTEYTTVARMVEGLGYRYYWATEGLSPEDLSYRPPGGGRSLRATLEHIYGLTETIHNAVTIQPNIRPSDWSDIPFDELRRRTLVYLQKASMVLRDASQDDMAQYKVIFQRPNGMFDFPFWNMINGPISDALYHTGQVVTFRRSSGNPIHPGVNVFMGKTRTN